MKTVCAVMKPPCKYRFLCILPLYMAGMVVMSSGAPGFSTVPSGQTPEWELLTACDTFDLFMQGELVGRQLYSCRIDTGPGRIVTDLEFTVTGGPSEMIVHERREFDLRGDIIRAEQELSGMGGTTRWELDGGILTVSTAGVPHRSRVGPVGDHLRTELLIQTAVLNQSAKVGMVWLDTTFDLVSASPVIVRTECVAEPGAENPGRYVFVNRDSAIRRDERWEVDTLGRTLLQQIASLYTARRTGVGEINTQPNMGSLQALTEMFSIPAENAPRRDQNILLRIAGGEKLPESVRLFYRKEADGYILEAPGAGCINGDFSHPIDSKKTVSTPVMQSDNGQVRELATKLVKPSMSRCEKIRIMNRYVYENIRKRNVATFSSALATLESGFGDCGEHAVLLGALLRAADIEAEIVYGLVHVSAKNGYYYHAWVLVPGKKTLFSDPALGRFPAVTGYIPLVVDNTGEKMVELGALIDRISIAHVEE